MKIGAATSTVLHAAVLGWGMLNISAPQVQQIELTGVEIDFETSETSTPVLGEKEADVSETPAPNPTQNPQENPEAQNIGDSNNDQNVKNEAAPADIAVEKTATAPEPDDSQLKPEENPVQEPEEVPPTATELAALNDPATPITEEPPSEEPPLPSEADEQLAALPENVPVPVLKPKPPKPNTAKTNQRDNSKKQPSQTASTAKKSDDPSVSDIIKNNRNTQDAASGGQKRSNQTASLGTSTDSFATRLSRREEDQLISRISRCSTGQAGQVISPDLRVTIILELNPDGSFKISPKGKAVGGTSAEKNRFTRDALRYALRCAPYDFLPQEKYDTWKEIVITFHPSEMFR